MMSSSAPLQSNREGTVAAVVGMSPRLDVVTTHVQRLLDFLRTPPPLRSEMDIQCVQCYVRSARMLRQFSPPVLRELCRFATYVEARKGSVLFLQNSSITGDARFLLILSGSVGCFSFDPPAVAARKALETRDVLHQELPTPTEIAIAERSAIETAAARHASGQYGEYNDTIGPGEVLDVGGEDAPPPRAYTAIAQEVCMFMAVARRDVVQALPRGDAPEFDVPRALAGAVGAPPLARGGAGLEHIVALLRQYRLFQGMSMSVVRDLAQRAFLLHVSPNAAGLRGERPPHGGPAAAAASEPMGTLSTGDLFGEDTRGDATFCSTVVASAQGAELLVVPHADVRDAEAAATARRPAVVASRRVASLLQCAPPREAEAVGDAASSLRGDARWAHALRALPPVTAARVLGVAGLAADAAHVGQRLSPPPPGAWCLILQGHVHVFTKPAAGGAAAAALAVPHATATATSSSFGIGDASGATESDGPGGRGGARRPEGPRRRQSLADEDAAERATAAAAAATQARAAGVLEVANRVGADSDGTSAVRVALRLRAAVRAAHAAPQGGEGSPAPRGDTTGSPTPSPHAPLGVGESQSRATNMTLRWLRGGAGIGRGAASSAGASAVVPAAPRHPVYGTYEGTLGPGDSLTDTLRWGAAAAGVVTSFVVGSTGAYAARDFVSTRDSSAPPGARDADAAAAAAVSLLVVPAAVVGHMLLPVHFFGVPLMPHLARTTADATPQRRSEAGAAALAQYASVLRPLARASAADLAAVCGGAARLAVVEDGAIVAARGAAADMCVIVISGTLAVHSRALTGGPGTGTGSGGPGVVTLSVGGKSRSRRRVADIGASPGPAGVGTGQLGQATTPGPRERGVGAAAAATAAGSTLATVRFGVDPARRCDAEFIDLHGPWRRQLRAGDVFNVDALADRPPPPIGGTAAGQRLL